MDRDLTLAQPQRLGLRANALQFTLLAVVNAFVGGMVGMGRSILPAIAEQDFHLAARVAVLSFIVVFGVTKAFTNYLVGRLSEFAGYLAVAASALATGWIAAHHGLRPQPFFLGVAFVAVGLVLSIFIVRAAGDRHGDGVPDSACGHRGRGAPLVARLLDRRLPALARPRLRGGCSRRGRHGGRARARIGDVDRRDGHADLGSRRRGAHDGDARQDRCRDPGRALGGGLGA